VEKTVVEDFNTLPQHFGDSNLESAGNSDLNKYQQTEKQRAAGIRYYLVPQLQI